MPRRINRETARFFESNNVTITPGVIWTRVHYRKGTKSLVKTAKHYKMHFLQPADEILVFHESETVSIDGKEFIVADAIIDNALKKVPHKHAIASVHLTNLKHYKEEAVCDNPNPEKEAFEFYAQYAPEAAARARQYFAEYTEDPYTSALDELKGMRPNQRVVDVMEMTSEVKFCHHYCKICLSTEHRFTDCDQRGCRICLDKNHPFWKCAQHCKCGEGRLHSKQNCTNREDNYNEGPNGFAMPALA